RRRVARRGRRGGERDAPFARRRPPPERRLPTRRASVPKVRGAHPLARPGGRETDRLLVSWVPGIETSSGRSGSSSAGGRACVLPRGVCRARPARGRGRGAVRGRGARLGAPRIPAAG